MAKQEERKESKGKPKKSIKEKKAKKAEKMKGKAKDDCYQFKLTETLNERTSSAIKHKWYST